MPIAWVHDLNPWVIRISGDVGVRWYGLSYLLGFAWAYLMLRWLASRRMIEIPKDRALDVVIFGALCAVIGGRLGYVLFYDPPLLWTFFDSPPWWGVLALNHGGMASHGGILGVIFAAWRVSRGYKNDGGEIVGRCSPVHVMDVFAFIAPIGLMFGRLANFINGELLGRVVAKPGEEAPWWAVRFPQEHLTGHAPELTDEQYRGLLSLANRVHPEAPNFGIKYERVMERIQGGDKELAAQLAPYLSARHASQLYQAVAEGIVLSIVLWIVWARPRIDGVLGCWFMMTYGVLRVATEHWRLPDDHLDVAKILGLSRGQWLSVLMIAVGAGCLVWRVRSGKPKHGGWLVKPPSQSEPSG